MDEVQNMQEGDCSGGVVLIVGVRYYTSKDKLSDFTRWYGIYEGIKRRMGSVGIGHLRRSVELG